MCVGAKRWNMAGSADHLRTEAEGMAAGAGIDEGEADSEEFDQTRCLAPRKTSDKSCRPRESLGRPELLHRAVGHLYNGYTAEEEGGWSEWFEMV